MASNTFSLNDGGCSFEEKMSSLNILKSALKVCRYFRLLEKCKSAIRLVRRLLPLIIAYQKDLIFEKSLLSPIKKRNPKVNVTFRELSFDGLQELSKIMHSDPSQIESRLVEGQKCFLACAGDKIVHYAWVGFKGESIPPVFRQKELGAEEACIHNSRTSPEFRGLSIYQYMLSSICEHLKLRGFHRVVIWTRSQNIPSIIGIEKVGFERIKEVSYLKVWKFVIRIYERKTK